VPATILFNFSLYISSLWASWAVKSLWWRVLGLYLASWLWLVFKVIFVFLTLILIRITVPRFKLETLSRLSWYGLFAFGACLLLCYLLGGFWC
jgi:NADH:ubiquinone oxidoreductase subunit H